MLCLNDVLEDWPLLPLNSCKNTACQTGQVTQQTQSGRSEFIYVRRPSQKPSILWKSEVLTSQLVDIDQTAGLGEDVAADVSLKPGRPFRSTWTHLSLGSAGHGGSRPTRWQLNLNQISQVFILTAHCMFCCLLVCFAGSPLFVRYKKRLPVVAPLLFCNRVSGTDV